MEDKKPVWPEGIEIRKFKSHAALFVRDRVEATSGGGCPVAKR